jgi:hypothetical protein
MSNADTVIAALRSGYDSLAGRVAGFSDEDLGSGAEISRAAIQAALDGEPNPGPGFNHAVWDKWNAMTRRERAGGFLQSNQALLALLESLDAGTRDTLRIDMGFLPAPADLATAVRLRLNEFTLHSWDIRAGVGEHPTLPAEAWLRLVAGRLAPPYTPASLTAAGAADLDLLRKVFPGY